MAGLAAAMAGGGGSTTVGAIAWGSVLAGATGVAWAASIFFSHSTTQAEGAGSGAGASGSTTGWGSLLPMVSASGQIAQPPSMPAVNAASRA